MKKYLEIPDDCLSRIEKIDHEKMKVYAETSGIKNFDKDNLYHLVMYKVANSFFSLPSRKVDKKNIERELQNIEDKKGSQCIGNKMLMDTIDIKNLVGIGAYGATYTSDIVSNSSHTEEMILKFFPIEKSYYKVLVSGWSKLQPWRNPKKLREISSHYLVNKILDEGICPNLVYMYHWFLCKKCDFLQRKRKGEVKEIRPQECVIYCLEKADGDIRKLSTISRKENWTFDKKGKVYKTAIFQTIFALGVLQKYYGMDHSDAGLRNILFKKINIFESKNTYWTYIFNGETYHVPNNGYIFLLADYGLANSSRIFGDFFKGNIVRSNMSEGRKLTREYENDKVGYPEGPNNMKLLDPFYNPYYFHTRDKGLAIFVKEMIKMSGEGIEDIRNTLSNMFISKTGDTVEALLRKKNNPALDYNEIFSNVFGDFKKRPEGICLGIYNADKPLSFDIDEFYINILRTKLF